MIDKIFAILVTLLLIIAAAGTFIATKQYLYKQRQDSYQYCLEEEMGEGHGDKYGYLTWHGPNLLERLGHANQVCNAKFKEVYGIYIQEDRVL